MNPDGTLAASGAVTFAVIGERVALQLDGCAFGYTVPKGDFDRLVAAATLAVDRVINAGQRELCSLPRFAQIMLVAEEEAAPHAAEPPGGPTKARVLRSWWLPHACDNTPAAFARLCDEFEKGTLWRMLQMVAVSLQF